MPSVRPNADAFKRRLRAGSPQNPAERRDSALRIDDDVAKRASRCKARRLAGECPQPGNDPGKDVKNAVDLFVRILDTERQAE